MIEGEVVDPRANADAHVTGEAAQSERKPQSRRSSSGPSRAAASRDGAPDPVGGDRRDGRRGGGRAAACTFLISALPSPRRTSPRVWTASKRPLPLRTPRLSRSTRRVGALEAAAARPPDKTLADAYGQRIAALESAALSAKAAADANDGSLAEARAARADAAKALELATSAAQIANGAPAAQTGGGAELASALEGRVAKVEAGLAALDRPPVDLSPINQRLDKLESALAAPKSETRAAAEAAAPARDGAALAVVAQALADRLRAGAPFAGEEAALERLGADPARLAALKPFAEKGRRLRRRSPRILKRVAPTVAAAAASKPAGMVDRLFASMGKVVRVTPVGEVGRRRPLGAGLADRRRAGARPHRRGARRLGAPAGGGAPDVAGMGELGQGPACRRSGGAGPSRRCDRPPRGGE